MTKYYTSFAAPVPLDKEPIIHDVLCNFRGQVVLAGGQFRAAMDGTQTKDWDLFLHKDLDHVDVYNYIKGLAGARLDIGQNVFETARARTIQPVFDKSYQLVTAKEFRFADPTEVIERFDFSNSRKAVWKSSVFNFFVIHEGVNFEADCKHKILRYEGKKVGPIALTRALKFAKLGYHINLKDLGTILAECEEARLEKNFSENCNNFVSLPKEKSQEYYELLSASRYY